MLVNPRLDEPRIGLQIVSTQSLSPISSVLGYSDRLYLLWALRLSIHLLPDRQLLSLRREPVTPQHYLAAANQIPDRHAACRRSKRLRIRIRGHRCIRSHRRNGSLVVFVIRTGSLTVQVELITRGYRRFCTVRR